MPAIMCPHSSLRSLAVFALAFPLSLLSQTNSPQTTDSADSPPQQQANPSVVNATSTPSATSVRPTPQRVRASQKVTNNLLISSVAPIYPPDAKRRHLTGTVVLQVVIGKDGRIAKIKQISGPDELASAAMTAVQQWVYRPFMLQGKPLEVDTQLTFNFNIP